MQGLLRKPMEFHLADQRKKLARLKEAEEGLITAPPVDPQNPSAASTTYVVEGSTIKSGAYTP